MKEVTKWDNNPREMLVWDDDVTHKIKAEVVYCCDAAKVKYPVIAISEGIIEGSQCLQVYKHCAEIEEPKTRRMTHQELSWWLREKPTREWTFIFQKPARAHTVFEYFDNEANQPVDEDIIIRENSGEWHEPLVEVEE